MRSTFAGLDIANRGLFVAQRQIDLAGHNIANANTEG
ncbi:MAG: flagellar basal body protein, partial [Oscillospiraceae bacterium]|nr:flagellar basal body protein [Oscillospiraceae bacterium]